MVTASTTITLAHAWLINEPTIFHMQTSPVATQQRLVAARFILCLRILPTRLSFRLAAVSVLYSTLPSVQPHYTWHLLASRRQAPPSRFRLRGAWFMEDSPTSYFSAPWFIIHYNSAWAAIILLFNAWYLPSIEQGFGFLDHVMISHLLSWSASWRIYLLEETSSSIDNQQFQTLFLCLNQMSDKCRYIYIYDLYISQIPTAYLPFRRMFCTAQEIGPDLA